MSRTLAFSVVALLLAGASASAQPAGDSGNAALSNPGNQNGAPPPSRDEYCREQAADQTGYRPGGNSDSERAYGSAYYACMDTADNAPPPPGYYPPPYPYPYPYPYYYGYGPYYGGPAIGLRFGFGGGWRGGRSR
jgi:hypothetical protein